MCAGYVGVRCDYYVCVLLVSEGGLEAVKVHQMQHLITLSAFRCVLSCVMQLFITCVPYSHSPYVPEEFVVFTEPGGLCLISPVSNITQITTPLHPQALCFGPHPRSVIIAVDSTVHKIDWRVNETVHTIFILLFHYFFRPFLSPHVSFMKLSSGSRACHMTRLTCSVCLCALGTISLPLI